MLNRIKFLINRIRERLWVRPFAICILSVGAVFLAKMVDIPNIGQFVPEITLESLGILLTTISASMLVIATFAVASMVAAYASASSTATPRSFSLVISDDVSQNALSSFLGAFIFSIVALIALKNGYYDRAGRFTLFSLTIIVFAIVIFMFVKWVDSIARLGRLGTIITKVERATAASLQRRRKSPTLRGIPAGLHHDDGQSIYGSSIGYVQHVNVTALQTVAEKSQVRITVAALPGTFSAPGRALAHVTADSGDLSGIETSQIEESFVIGDNRKFDDDPRFGLIVLSEIASRALSPAVNDPGTAIQVIGAFVRLFALWSEPIKEDDRKTSDCNRVEVPQISLRDMFDDAFTAIARDGAGMIEVAGRLQKSLESLSSTGDAKMRTVAIHHSRLALARAEKALELSEDLEVVRKLAKFANQVQQNDSAR